MNTTTSLSSGLVLYRLLTGDAGVSAMATEVFPVATSEAILPYVAYRRARLDHEAAKGRGADTVTAEVRCYAATYTESVELAERVRAALDYRTTDGAGDGGLRLRACLLTGAEEFAEGDAYVQHLVFTLRL